MEVPNAPCGVESPYHYLKPRPTVVVPNAPCGVESTFEGKVVIHIQPFLMHRVELKASFEAILFLSLGIVPNAPCGVERGVFLKKFSNFVNVPNAPCGVESLFCICSLYSIH